ncbi:MAG: hypothetical protein ACFFBV_13975 [Promethearchaeota archaeon]
MSVRASCERAKENRRRMARFVLPYLVSTYVNDENGCWKSSRVVFLL